MSSSPLATHLFVEEEVPFLIPIRQRTSVATVELLAVSPLPPGVYCVWALAAPVSCRLSADMTYATVSPVIIGGITVFEGSEARDAVYQIPLSEWQLEPGTNLFMHVAAASASADAVSLAMIHTTRRVGSKRGGPGPTLSCSAALGGAPQVSADPAAGVELYPLVSVRLCGTMSPEVVEDDQIEWIPFLAKRWFEIAGDDLAEATLVFRPSTLPMVEDRPIVSEEASETHYSLFQGGVKEAAGVDEDLAYVKWADASVGLMPELRPYYRIFTPAREGKTVRVRRFPHRNADIVGEIAFGTSVTAIGRQIDPFTDEAYVLVVLPSDPALLPLITLYGLASLSPSQWLWGWSKVAGRAGLVLLNDITADSQAGYRPLALQPTHLPYRGVYERIPQSPHQRTTLPSPTYYTPTRPSRNVRIRKRATRQSKVIGELEPNEVKEAISILSVHRADDCPNSRTGGKPKPGVGNEIPETVPRFVHSTEFVEWMDGGFSVLSDEKQVFLRTTTITHEVAQRNRESDTL